MYKYPTISMFAQHFSQEDKKEEISLLEKNISTRKNRARQSHLKQRTRKN
jgi:hypothetical protein